MLTAIFADIHSNIEALKTAVREAEERGISKFAVLGDTVGYGANPNECLEWALEFADICLMGNHEQAVFDPAVRDWFNPEARAAIEWTAKELDQNLIDRLHSLPFAKLSAAAAFAHGSPDEPEKFRYLLGGRDAAPSFNAFKAKVCFVGHTHVPSCFCEKSGEASYLMPGVIQLKKGERYILNPGSVGQPRDRDPRLSFGVYDDQRQTFEIVRLVYPKQRAAAKIRKAGLPAWLAERLL